MKSSTIKNIMFNEWSRLWCARIPAILMMMLIVLWAIATMAAFHHWQDHARVTSQVTERSSQDWQSQPDRHPPCRAAPDGHQRLRPRPRERAGNFRRQ